MAEFLFPSRVALQYNCPGQAHQRTPTDMRNIILFPPFPHHWIWHCCVLTCTGLGVLGTLAYAKHLPSLMNPTLSMACPSSSKAVCVCVDEQDTQVDSYCQDGVDEATNLCSLVLFPMWCLPPACSALRDSQHAAADKTSPVVFSHCSQLSGNSKAGIIPSVVS